MHILKNNSKRQDWENVKSWNYKLTNLNPSKSIVYVEVSGDHGEVTTKDSEWIYYIVEGEGEFIINGVNSSVSKGDVITIPAKTKYNYSSRGSKPLKVVMFIDLWDN